jgi:hypothetical protein
LLSNIMLSFNTILPSLVLSITIFCFHLVWWVQSSNGSLAKGKRKLCCHWFRKP